MEPEKQLTEASERKAGTGAKPRLTGRSGIPEGFPKRAKINCLWRNIRSERERVSDCYSSSNSSDSPYFSSFSKFLKLANCSLK